MNAHSQIHIPVVTLLFDDPLTAYMFGEVRRTKEYPAYTELTVIGIEVVTYSTRDDRTPWFILEQVGDIRYGIPIPKLRRLLREGRVEIHIDGERSDDYAGLEQLVNDV